jgi:hypothetical protein
MPPTSNIEPGWTDLDIGTAALQGFLGWRLEMTVRSSYKKSVLSVSSAVQDLMCEVHDAVDRQ